MMSFLCPDNRKLGSCGQLWYFFTCLDLNPTYSQQALKPSWFWNQQDTINPNKESTYCCLAVSWLRVLLVFHIMSCWSQPPFPVTTAWLTELPPLLNPPAPISTTSPSFSLLAHLHGKVDIIGNSFTWLAVYPASPGWSCQVLWAVQEGLLLCVSDFTENRVMSPHGGMQEGRAAEKDEFVFYKLKVTRWIIQPIQCVLTFSTRNPPPFTHLSAHHQPLARPSHMTRLWPFP